MAEEQRSGREMMMTPEECDAFLRTERTCRLATVNAKRGVHVSALWFAWDGDAIWILSLIKSQRWKDLERDPRTSVVIDTGHEIGELRGVEVSGRVEVVGEVPRVGEANPALEEPERLYAMKYMGVDKMSYLENHAWLKLVPERLLTWDYRKMG